MNSLRTQFFFSFLFYICFSSLSHAQLKEAVLQPQTPMPGDEFGISVAIHKHWGVVGAYLDDEKASDAGAAYVYENQNGSWQFSTKLMASDGTSIDLFGNAVAVQDNQILVGADFDSARATGSGSAYLFEYDGNSWTEKQKIIPTDGQEGDHFGISVAISPGHILIGAPTEDSMGNNAGAAYFYINNNGTWEEQKVVASDVEADDRFGEEVAIHGLVAIISSHGDDDNGGASGAAYIYSFDGAQWIFDQKIFASNPTPGSQFGASVDISGNRVIVGANLTGINKGTAYIFEQSNGSWDEITMLTASDGADSDEFGGAVGISGDTAIVGTIGDDDNGNLSGSAYMFVKDSVGNGWTETKLLASDGMLDGRFGNAVAVDAGALILGSHRHDGNGDKSGRAYIFSQDASTSISPTLALEDMKIYPNPAQSDLHLSFTFPHTNPFEVQLLDTQGKRIITDPVEAGNPTYSQTFSVEHLSAGMYFLQVLSSKGQFSQKIMIR